MGRPSSLEIARAVSSAFPPPAPMTSADPAFSQPDAGIYLELRTLPAELVNGEVDAMRVRPVCQ